jgi:TetR/AcrR family transcriptional repressor of nem operon
MVVGSAGSGGFYMPAARLSGPGTSLTVRTSWYGRRMTTRDRLVESTRELLWERGYVGTSPRAILDRAGVGQGSLYHHFAGKPDLALAAVRASAAELTAMAEDQLSRPGTAAERVAGFLSRDRGVLKGCPIGGLTQDPEILAIPALHQPVQQTLAWLRARIAEVIAEGQAAGDVRADVVPTDLAATIVAVLQGGYVLARAADSPEPFDAAISGVLALLAGTAG